MADNRLYLANKETLEYVCIGKALGNEWQIGNVDILQGFLSESLQFGNNSNLIIGTENDEAFWGKYINGGINKNVKNVWLPVNEN